MIESSGLMISAIESGAVSVMHVASVEESVTVLVEPVGNKIVVLVEIRRILRHCPSGGIVEDLSRVELACSDCQ